jgi:hypothetical protein
MRGDRGLATTPRLEGPTALETILGAIDPIELARRDGRPALLQDDCRSDTTKGMKLVELLRKGALPHPFWDGAEDAA